MRSTFTRQSKKVDIPMEKILYQLLYLYFDLAPVPNVFTKFLKIALAFLRRLRIHITVNLYLLIIDKVKEKITTLPDSHSFASVPRICQKVN